MTDQLQTEGTPDLHLHQDHKLNLQGANIQEKDHLDLHTEDIMVPLMEDTPDLPMGDTLGLLTEDTPGLQWEDFLHREDIQGLLGGNILLQEDIRGLPEEDGLHREDTLREEIILKEGILH